MAFPGVGGNLNRKYSTFQYLMHAPSFIRLFWRLLHDKRVWFMPKMILVLGLIYVAVPLDLIPGFPLVFVGYLDDALVLYLAARAFIWLCPKNVVKEHVQLIDQGG